MNTLTNSEKLYLSLMGKYKQSRGLNPIVALKFLKAAQVLKRTNELSEQVILGSAYL
jgi:hypothetical protein